MQPKDLRGLLDHVAHWLPTQGPIQEFIHHNTLHAYQNYSFENGVLIASRLLGARSHFPLPEYERLYKEGRISESVLKSALQERKQTYEWLTQTGVPAETVHPGIAKQGLRSRWKSQYGLSLNSMTHPSLFRMVGSYLDQGIAVWRMPHAEEQSLYTAVRSEVKKSWIPWVPLSDPAVRALFELSPEEVIHHVLSRFVGGSEHFERYLLEMCLAHPGWSGMVREVELRPELLVQKRKVSLLEFCALELLMEFGFVCRKLGKDFGPLSSALEVLPLLPTDKGYQLELSPTEKRQSIWHDAYERSYYEQTLAAISQHPEALRRTSLSVQAFFCIDDRECSLRRRLEEVNPTIQTFSTAGFFGVDCFFQGSDDVFPFKHCPVPVTPKHLVREVRLSTEKPKRSWVRRRLHLEYHANTFFRGWLISQTLGAWSAVRLALSLFNPSTSPATATSLSRVKPDTDFHFSYSEQEMAERVAAQLRATGLATRPLSELIVFFGHGASSVNNPYFAAYDCGACSGKPGAPNARAFAIMANRSGVRSALKDLGISIPETCWFVGALHDTTRDEVMYYDLEKLPQALQSRFQYFKGDMEKALQGNAKERCARFLQVPKEVSEEGALKEVRRRSVAIFEPRPELNHATNAAAIVGPRELTQGISLDRRAFLNSYDSSSDPSGEILVKILSAVVPVCGGINLEYYFSKIDSSVHGAGTKLPHNVSGLIGVMNGTEGDLLTGLPTQMTEIHEPVRLMLLVEQEHGVALQAAKKLPDVYEWIQNGWVRFFSITPGTKEIWEFHEGEMRRWGTRSWVVSRTEKTSQLVWAGTR